MATRGRTSTTKYKIGDLVTGKVTKLASFGAFVQLKDDIDGLVHISQLSEDHVAKVKDILKVGQEVEARVIKVDKAERRVGLSIKAANYSEEDLKRESEAFDNVASGRGHGRVGTGVPGRPGRVSPRRWLEEEVGFATNHMRISAQIQSETHKPRQAARLAGFLAYGYRHRAISGE